MLVIIFNLHRYNARSTPLSSPGHSSYSVIRIMGPICLIDKCENIFYEGYVNMSYICDNYYYWRIDHYYRIVINWEAFILKEIMEFSIIGKLKYKCVRNDWNSFKHILNRSLKIMEFWFLKASLTASNNSVKNWFNQSESARKSKKSRYKIPVRKLYFWISFKRI